MFFVIPNLNCLRSADEYYYNCKGVSFAPTAQIFALQLEEKREAGEEILTFILSLLILS